MLRKCTCFFCSEGRDHKHSLEVKWTLTGELQVAESLDTKDILATRTCNMCGHREEDPNPRKWEK